MKDNSQMKRNVTVTDAIKNLRENGIEVTENQAAKVLDLLYFLASLIIKANFSDKMANRNEP
jgi:hypothetical protein